ncbi:LAMI_0E09626g1_1 [Lachancea mirantina]|uniref:Exocyst complex component Sec8 n=1 Tax=Lachancea mirantina TaxID=1230905 RepID=A0A1G4JNR7_9SACH|nr:LAMI_0E09626g1_1 [Lachancea mirantina]
MNKLGVPVARRRGLSVNEFTDDERRAMNNALDNLKDDMNLVETRWNKILHENTNPLELALSLLDDTSVGLGHRLDEFKTLQSKVASDLQQAANEHYQAFNSSIASYEQTVELINVSQHNITSIRNKFDESLVKFNSSKDSLGELNESSMRYTSMIEVIDSLERLVAIPALIEEKTREKSFDEAKDALLQVHELDRKYNIWSMPCLQAIKQQVNSYNDSLFETIMEEINDLIYSKRLTSAVAHKSNTKSNEEAFSVENYLSSIVNIDIGDQARTLNSSLFDFLKKLGKQASSENASAKMHDEDSDYSRLFNLLRTLNDLNKLRPATKSILERTREEIHTIVKKTSEEIRENHPSLLKMAVTMDYNNDYGLFGQNAVSAMIRNFFWSIFTKLSFAVQAHRAVYEIIRFFSPPSLGVEHYDFEKIWHQTLIEIKTLFINYTCPPSIFRAGSPHGLTFSNGSQADTKQAERTMYFSLQSNISDTSAAQDHANVLKNMLKELFPGFSASTSIEPNSIFLEEEHLEQEETLIPANVFNVVLLLEPFLLYIQGTMNAIPNVEQDIQSPVDFFGECMLGIFVPCLERTLKFYFSRDVDTADAYSLVTIAEQQSIYKSAFEFKKLFFKILYLMNTTHTYRKPISRILLLILDQFHLHFSKTFENVMRKGRNRFDRYIASVWMRNKKLLQTTENIINGNAALIPNETSELFINCPEFYVENKGISRQDFLTSATLGSLITLGTTVTWINEWLPRLRKQTEPVTFDARAISADELRAQWSIFEVSEFDNYEQMSNLKFSLNGEALTHFDKLISGFKSIETSVLSTLRYDIRARTIHFISHFFQTSSWNPDVVSVELDENIAVLTSELSTMENRYREGLTKNQVGMIFSGLPDVLSYAFIKGSRSIPVLTQIGVKRILRNINVLQHAFRNIIETSTDNDMSSAVSYFQLCLSNEKVVIEMANSGKLSEYSAEDIKNIIRLQFSEEMSRAVRRQGSMGRMPSTSANKRLSEALARLKLKI